MKQLGLPMGFGAAKHGRKACETALSVECTQQEASKDSACCAGGQEQETGVRKARAGQWEPCSTCREELGP
jgi:hypothetical protein